MDHFIGMRKLLLVTTLLSAIMSEYFMARAKDHQRISPIILTTRKLQQVLNEKPMVLETRGLADLNFDEEPTYKDDEDNFRSSIGARFPDNSMKIIPLSLFDGQTEHEVESLNESGSEDTRENDPRNEESGIKYSDLKCQGQNVKPTLLLSLQFHELHDKSLRHAMISCYSGKCRRFNQRWKVQQPFYVEEPSWVQIDEDYPDVIARFDNKDPFFVSRGKRTFGSKETTKNSIHVNTRSYENFFENKEKHDDTGTRHFANTPEANTRRHSIKFLHAQNYGGGPLLYRFKRNDETDEESFNFDSRKNKTVSRSTDTSPINEAQLKPQDNKLPLIAQHFYAKELSRPESNEQRDSIIYVKGSEEDKKKKQQVGGKGRPQSQVELFNAQVRNEVVKNKKNFLTQITSNILKKSTEESSDRFTLDDGTMNDNFLHSRAKRNFPNRSLLSKDESLIANKKFIDDGKIREQEDRASTLDLSYMDRRDKHSDILDILGEPFFISRGKKTSRGSKDNYPKKLRTDQAYHFTAYDLGRNEMYDREFLENILKSLSCPPSENCKPMAMIRNYNEARKLVTRNDRSMTPLLPTFSITGSSKERGRRGALEDLFDLAKEDPYYVARGKRTQLEEELDNNQRTMSNPIPPFLL